MTETASETRSPDIGGEKICPQCQGTYQPARPSQVFCGKKCRDAWHIDHGHRGAVASVRRLKRGISIVLHTDDEGLLNLELGQVVRVVKVA